MCGLARQTGGHPHLFGIHSKMHQRAPFEFKDHFARITVCPVLLFCLFDGLSAEWVLELKRCDGDAVQAEGDVEGKSCIALAEVELAREANAVGGIARFQVGVQSVGSFEVGNSQGASVTFESVTERM